MIRRVTTYKGYRVEIHKDAAGNSIFSMVLGKKVYCSVSMIMMEKYIDLYKIFNQ